MIKVDMEIHGPTMGPIFRRINQMPYQDTGPPYPLQSNALPGHGTPLFDRSRMPYETWDPLFTVIECPIRTWDPLFTVVECPTRTWDPLFINECFTDELTNLYPVILRTHTYL